MPDTDPLQILGTMLRKILKEKLVLRDGDRTRRVSKLEAVLRSLVARAMKGEVRVVAMLFELLKTAAQVDAVTHGIQITFVDGAGDIETFEERQDRVKAQHG